MNETCMTGRSIQVLRLGIVKLRHFNMGGWLTGGIQVHLASCLHGLKEELVIDIVATGRLSPRYGERKQHRSVSRGIRFFLMILASLNVASAQSSEVLSLDAHIPLPDVKGRIDHFSVDVRGQRLFVAAVENHSLEVIDLKSKQRVHTIADLAEPQGVFYDPATNHLFVACGLDGVTKVFDATSFQAVGTVKFPDDADNIRYDPRSKGVIVGYAGAKQLRNREEGTGGLGFIDSNGKKTGDIVVDAHPESFQLEKSGERIFVNVPEKKEIEVIDATKHSVTTRWPVSAEDNFPMALDEANHRLLVGVWNPPQLLIFDTETGRQVEAGEVAGKTDDLFYDSVRRRVYVLT